MIGTATSEDVTVTSISKSSAFISAVWPWSMPCLLCAIAACVVAGCRTDADHEQEGLKARITASIEAAEVGRATEGSTNEWLRQQYDEMIVTIKNATADNLARPTIMMAYVWRRPGRLRDAIVVRWISAEPKATGVRVDSGDSTIDLAFPESYLIANQQDSQHVIMFYAVVPANDASDIWPILDGGDARVSLRRERDVISDPHSLTLLE